MKKVTLGFIIKDDKILLPLKKRGFGANLYNGVGGKLEKGETFEEAMVREAKEEIGINIKKMEKVGLLKFYFKNKPDWNQYGWIYKITDYSGEIKETEEMKPYWFDLDKIPFEQMWEDDKIWFKDFLNDKKFYYKFFFDESGKLEKWGKIKFTF